MSKVNLRALRVQEASELVEILQPQYQQAQTAEAEASTAYEKALSAWRTEEAARHEKALSLVARAQSDLASLKELAPRAIEIAEIVAMLEYADRDVHWRLTPDMSLPESHPLFAAHQAVQQAQANLDACRGQCAAVEAELGAAKREHAAAVEAQKQHAAALAQAREKKAEAVAE